jgi:hypothetical protein
MNFYSLGYLEEKKYQYFLVSKTLAAKFTHILFLSDRRNDKVMINPHTQVKEYKTY